MASTLTTFAANDGRRRSSSTQPPEQFPPFEYGLNSSRDSLALDEDGSERSSTARGPSPIKRNGSIYTERWQPRRDNHVMWGNGSVNVAGPRHHRKSLSEAWQTIRTRRGSTSANAHELAEALKAPLSVKLTVSTYVDSKGMRLIGARSCAYCGIRALH